MKFTPWMRVVGYPSNQEICLVCTESSLMSALCTQATQTVRHLDVAAI